MAAGTPLTRLTLSATSVADDLGYVALSDLARALGDIAAECRVIGGHMVTVLAARWQLRHELYRETGDVDLGIPPIVARDHLRQPPGCACSRARCRAASLSRSYRCPLYPDTGTYRTCTRTGLTPPSRSPSHGAWPGQG
jgi:hypothetical protein